MVDESSPLLPPAEESIEAETDAPLEPEPESGEPTPEPTSEPGFVCDCEKWMRSACKGLPFYKEHESQRYCVLHYPGKEKSADFNAALDSKLNSKDFDFGGVWFPDEVDFSGFEFSADAYFSWATFSAGAHFSHTTFNASADFRHATFDEFAYFSDVTFNAAEFSYATFRANVTFLEAKFTADTEFSFATFSANADFCSVTFGALAGFSEATFNGTANFGGSEFRGEASFDQATFGANADFWETRFSKGAMFSRVTFNAKTDFDGAKFSQIAGFLAATFTGTVIFYRTTFNALAFFRFARFGPTNFDNSVFSGDADFSEATFGGDANFRFASFSKDGNFNNAVFNDFLRFFGETSERSLDDEPPIKQQALGKEPALDFQHVRIEHPERVAFHTLDLRPHWFVNVDSRQFVFTYVSWQWERTSIKQEIAALEAKDVSSPESLLIKACRQLAENAEANNRYEEASRFRYWAMDLARRTKWKRWSFWKTDWLHMLYWAVSGYGERILRALGVLAALWIVFVLLYTLVGFAQQSPKASNEGASSMTAASMTIEDRIGQPLEFSRALTYSLAVMTLQKPEPRPLTNWAHALVTLETILGPVQAALLALAIRRKFMR